MVIPGAGAAAYRSLRFRNMAVAGGLTAFVASVYVYTMKAVGGSDELQAAVEAFEKEQPKPQITPKPLQ
ncbi:hypothetical protein O6H91_05G098100 [Diphasiastrum complanatum]|uniref:Uncharacterized protein n=1 Tax=Diphasiastrum complanatum TaxID=34168 RepID=A0ACC2DR66_DIPCM|nr:hypothetical protein O6H91_Y490000 [Diphasiastrum complanatum]KAJ7556784.1 hypothetical protein O6H91_05G098100 [Diphasiastrum complanatum]